MDKLLKIIHREAELQRRFLTWHDRLQAGRTVRFAKAVWYTVSLLWREDEVEKLKDIGVVGKGLRQ
jgi:hypothetical protein